MKKLNLILCSVMVTGLLMTSCSSDDDSSNSNDVGIAGTYNLTAVNTEEATDFDMDETPHINQMEESDCYNGGKITLNSDSTFTYVLTGIAVNEADGTAGCIEETTVAGTWEIYAGTGNTAVINATYEGQNGNNVTLQLNKEGNELTVFTLFGEYPDRNSEGGAYYANGSVEYIFEK